MAIQNKFNTRCSNQNCPEKKNCYGGLKAGDGYAVKQNGQWKAYCNTCCPEKITPNQSQVTERKLTADGVVIMPFEQGNLPLLRAFPGYKNVKQPDGKWHTT